MTDLTRRRTAEQSCVLIAGGGPVGLTAALCLAEAGIVVTNLDKLDDADCHWLDAYFMERVFPVLTPLAIDPAHPFPFIPNMGLVMALRLQREEEVRERGPMLGAGSA